MVSGSRIPHAPVARAAAGGVALALSVAVLTRWLAPSAAPDLIRADWPPMHPHVAVGLILASVALLAALPGLAKIATAFGSAAVALGALLLARDGFQIDLEVGRTFGEMWPGGETSRPSPVPPNAALGLLLTGMAASCRGMLRPIGVACGAVALAMGLAGLIGSASGLSPPYWGSLALASPETAAGLVLLDAALVFRGTHAAQCRDPGLSWTGPLLAGVGSLCISLLLSQALLVRERDQVAAAVKATAHRIRDAVRLDLQTQREALEGLAREWEGTSFKFLWQGAWESDARIALTRSRGMSSIGWFESTGELDWIYPADASAPHLASGTTNIDAASTRSWMLPVKHADGATGFALLIPLSRPEAADSEDARPQDSSRGLFGVFRARDFFVGVSPLLPDGYSFRIDAAGVMLYAGNWSARAPDAWLERLPVERGSDVRLTVYPTSRWLAAQHGLLPHAVWVAGLVVSGLLVGALRAAQLSARARALEREMGTQARPEEQVRSLDRLLEERVSRRTAELERTNEKLERFACFLTHELRQPVAAQALWAELLDSECAGSLNERAREYIQEILRSTRRLNDLIQAQLSLAQVASTPLDLRTIDLATVIREVASDAKRELDEARAAIHLQDLPPVRGDVRQLYQLFRNLLENSIKYRRPGIPLEVRVCGARDGDAVEITWTDDGRGFEARDAERIFGAFERIDDRGGEGLGLGLTICRRVMERSGGSIVADASAGRGATFRLRFLAPRA